MALLRELSRRIALEWKRISFTCYLSAMQTLLRVRDACLALEAFQRARPEAVQTEAGFESR